MNQPSSDETDCNICSPDNRNHIGGADTTELWVSCRTSRQTRRHCSKELQSDRGDLLQQRQQGDGRTRHTTEVCKSCDTAEGVIRELATFQFMCQLCCYFIFLIFCNSLCASLCTGAAPLSGHFTSGEGLA